MVWVPFNRTSFWRDKMYLQLIACVLKFSPRFQAPRAVALSGGQKYVLEFSRKWYKERADTCTHKHPLEKPASNNIIKGSNYYLYFICWWAQVFGRGSSGRNIAYTKARSTAVNILLAHAVYGWRLTAANENGVFVWKQTNIFILFLHIPLCSENISRSVTLVLTCMFTGRGLKTFAHLKIQKGTRCLSIKT